VWVTLMGMDMARRLALFRGYTSWDVAFAYLNGLCDFQAKAVVRSSGLSPQWGCAPPGADVNGLVCR